MTSPTNWPNPERPGVPMFPERDGWHWLSVGDASPIPVEWNADHAPVAFDDWGWALGDYDDDLHSPEKAAKSMRYHGPVLTPTQLTELLAGERERCVEALQEVAEKYRKNAEEVGTVMATNSAEEKIEAVDDCWVKIRNLGDAP